MTDLERVDQRDDDDLEVDSRDERQIPQGPDDEGYEPPLVVPELDLQGGTVFKVGDQEFDSLEEATESVAPPQDEVVEEYDDEVDPNEEV